MSGRIWTLTRFLLGSLVRSVTGALYILMAGALWWLFFNPRSGRVPDNDYFMLLVGMFGLVTSFLVTLTVGTRANMIDSAPFFPRLPSRVEYLAAVLVATLVFVLSLQALLGLVIMIQPAGPEMGWLMFLNVVPVWISADIFAVVLALHATDFVMKGWSRVGIFGVLAVLLFSQSIDTRGIRWMTERLNGIANYFANQQSTGLAQTFRNASNWVNTSGQSFLSDTIGFIFWPFDAISQAAQNGFFDNAQALAPAILLLYATILFMLAADFFATKDMQLIEG